MCSTKWKSPWRICELFLPRALIGKRLQRTILSIAFVQVAEMAFSENVGVLSGPSARRWADSLAKSAGSSGLGSGLASFLGPRLAASLLRQTPLGNIVPGQNKDIDPAMAMSALTTALGILGKDDSKDLRKSLLPQLLDAIPGVGTAKEVALLDGNLLFYEPSVYLRHSQRIFNDALSILPVEFAALVLAARTFLKGEKVRTLEPKDQPRD